MGKRSREPEPDWSVDDRAGRRPAFRDESLAPEVDGELIQALIRRELPEHEAREVYRLIYTFRSWHQTHERMLIERFKQTPGGL